MKTQILFWMMPMKNDYSFYGYLFSSLTRDDALKIMKKLLNKPWSVA